jgi:transposase-like protein
MLRQWYKEYTETGCLHKLHGKKPKYSLAQKKLAVDYYMEHGRNMARTIRAIGYPHRDTMREWLHDLDPKERKVYSKHSSMVEYTPEQKKRLSLNLA